MFDATVVGNVGEKKFAFSLFLPKIRFFLCLSKLMKKKRERKMKVDKVGRNKEKKQLRNIMAEKNCDFFCHDDDSYEIYLMK